MLNKNFDNSIRPTYQQKDNIGKLKGEITRAKNQVKILSKDILKFHNFSMTLAFFSHSMIYSGLENPFFIFQVFHDFPGRFQAWFLVVIKGFPLS